MWHPAAEQAEQVEAPRVEDAGGTCGASADHGQGSLRPLSRLDPRDAPGDGRVCWGLQLGLSSPATALPRPAWPCLVYWASPDSLGG